MATMLTHVALATTTTVSCVSRRSLSCSRTTNPSSRSSQQCQVTINRTSAHRSTTSRLRWRVCATAHDSSSESTDSAVGFVPLVQDTVDGVSETAAKGDVPISAQLDYRKVEDPEWLERELLRADDGYPTSRGAVVLQSLKTGDFLGFAYALSSVNLSITLLVASYVALAAARIETETSDALFTTASDAAYAVGLCWKPLFLSGAASAAVEVKKFVDTVVGVQNRRKM